MSKQSPPPPPPEPLARYLQLLGEPRYSPSRFALLIGMLVIVLIFILLVILPLPILKGSRPGPAPTVESSPVALVANTGSGALLLVLPGANDLPDIYYYDPATTSGLDNLTNSAGVSEILPAVSPDGKQVAYYAVGGDGIAELYVKSIAADLPRPLTITTGATRLHAGFEIATARPPLWSPAGTRLAFLARQVDQKGDAIELYIADSQTGQLRDLTASGNQIVDYAWLNDDEIAYMEARGDGQKVVQQRAVVQLDSVPLPIATLASPK